MESILPSLLLMGLVMAFWWFGVLQPLGKARDPRRLLLLLGVLAVVILGGMAFAELRR